ncbi:MAG: VCBS repeat-containing protein [Verrucomicrobiota bacterium]
MPTNWGFYLWNITNALVSGNTLDSSTNGIVLFNAHFLRQPIDTYFQRQPDSFLAANHNSNGSALIQITPWAGSPVIGTQQKGDFFLNGSPALLWRNTNTGQNVLWPMNGTNTNSCSCCGTLSSNGLPSMPAGWVISGTADFTGDCNNDILWTMPGTTNVLLWMMQGPSFISSNWLPALGNSSYGIVGTGDFSGDGKADIVITNSFGPVIRFMDGTSKISDIPITNLPPTSTAKVVGVGDFTGSGQTDILWRDYTTGNNFVWVMQGTNVIGTNDLASQGDANWQVQGVGDFNGDGIADILWRHAQAGSNQLWLTSSLLGTNYTNVVMPQLTNLNWAIAGPK